MLLLWWSQQNIKTSSTRICLESVREDMSFCTWKQLSLLDSLAFFVSSNKINLKDRIELFLFQSLYFSLRDSFVFKVPRCPPMYFLSDDFRCHLFLSVIICWSVNLTDRQHFPEYPTEDMFDQQLVVTAKETSDPQKTSSDFYWSSWTCLPNLRKNINAQHRDSFR